MKKKSIIKSVRGFCLDCYFMYDGNLFQVTKFPTRSMVCGDLVHKFLDPCVYSVKVPIKEVDQLETMDWHIQEAGKERKNWRMESKKYWETKFTPEVEKVIKKDEKIFPSVKKVVLRGYHETFD